MNRTKILLLPLVTTVFFKSCASSDAQDEQKDSHPNVVVILVDDMVFSDPGCFGGEIHTPNINWLARTRS